MNLEQLQERLNKALNKKAKLEASLEKRQKQKEKILSSYKMNKDICAIIPFEVFDNFKYVSWRDLSAGVKNNKEFEEQRIAYSKSHGWDTFAQELMEYSNKMKDIVERIYNNERELKNVQDNISKLENDMKSERGNQTDVDILFAKIPELKTFLDTCAEKQYQFLVKRNEEIQKKWDEYYAEESKLNKCYRSQTLLDGRTVEEAGMTWGEFNKWYRLEYLKLNNIKPNGSYMPERMIKSNIESWKRSESKLMADRIKTEFGEVISTQLSLGADGNVNGIIRGTLKSAKLETIWAGGYNIQRLHTRLLFHEF